MGDPQPSKETLVAYNEPIYLPTNPIRYDTLVIKEKKEEGKGKKVIDTLNVAFKEIPLPMTPIEHRRTKQPKKQKILMTPADSIFFDFTYLTIIKTPKLITFAPINCDLMFLFNTTTERIRLNNP